MKKEYDFTQAKQGKFYLPNEEFNYPVYLSQDIITYYSKRASEKKMDLSDLINIILEKEMEILKKV